jgi:hypothetical protein
MTTTTFSPLTTLMTGSLPRIDTDLLRTAAAIVAAVASSTFVLSILATVQAGL